MAFKCAKAMRFMYSHSLFMIVIKKFFIHLVDAVTAEDQNVYLFISFTSSLKTVFLFFVIFFYFYFYDIIYFVISPEAVNGEDNYTEINIKIFLCLIWLCL